MRTQEEETYRRSRDIDRGREAHYSFDHLAAAGLPIIYSCQPSTSDGFSHYALYVYRPRTTRAQAVVASWRADVRFPRHIHTKDLLKFALRHQRRARWFERMVADEIWRSYRHWRGAQTKLAT